MAKHHHMPLSGGDRKAVTKELAKSRAMTGIFAERADEKRRLGEALIREADNLSCQSWNEKMWSDGGPDDPSPKSIRRPTAASRGWRSNARDARPSVTLSYACCATWLRRACTISRAGWSVRSARVLASAQPQRCSSLRSANEINHPKSVRN
jgi:hypothetical protein